MLIKLFESFSNKFEEIPRRYYADIIKDYSENNSNFVEFSTYENGVLQSDIDLEFQYNSSNVGYLYLNKKDFHIYKLHDEWFYINCNNTHYKCDGFEGVINCIDSIKRFKSIGYNDFTYIIDEHDGFNEFTEKEKEHISKFGKFRVSTLKYSNVIFLEVIKGSSVATSTIARIFKLSDEWYYIAIHTYGKFYKCDGFEGVINCLYYIKNNLDI